MTSIEFLDAAMLANIALLPMAALAYGPPPKKTGWRLQGRLHGRAHGFDWDRVAFNVFWRDLKIALNRQYLHSYFEAQEWNWARGQYSVDEWRRAMTTGRATPTYEPLEPPYGAWRYFAPAMELFLDDTERMERVRRQGELVVRDIPVAETPYGMIDESFPRGVAHIYEFAA